jgi:hypothetical protein
MRRGAAKSAVSRAIMSIPCGDFTHGSQSAGTYKLNESSGDPKRVVRPKLFEWAAVTQTVERVYRRKVPPSVDGRQHLIEPTQAGMALVEDMHRWSGNRA